MSTRDELISAVLAAPDDDAPRQVLADWFDEQGDARGELIHVGLALAHSDFDEAQRRACERRYAELIEGPGTLWLAELGLKNEVVTFRRGMVEGVALPWARFAPVAERLFATTPLRELTTWDFDAHGLRQWQHVPWLGRLRALHLRTLTQVAGVLAAEGLRLEALTLEAPQPGPASPVAQLMKWSGLESLRALSLIKTSVSNRDLEFLVPALKRLEVLDLTMNLLARDAPLALGPSTRTLRVLRLGSNAVGDGVVSALASDAALGRLEVLGLQASSVGDRGAAALLNSATLTSLRELDLSFNRVTDAGAVELAALPRRLRTLDLTFNLVGAAGDRALRAAWGSAVRI